MTIPVTPDFFLVQNIFGLETALPEDVIVNTFIFENAPGIEPFPGDANTRASGAVERFFTGTSVPEGPLAGAHTSAPLALMPSNVVSWTHKVYDLGDPPGGRAPVTIDKTSLMPARSTAARMPNEVAVCLSLQTAIIGRRGKGRVFLGPFVSAVGENKPGGLGVTEAFRKRLAANAAILALNNQADVEWCVWSTTRSAMARVIGGHVDDAFDTQRRRGTKAQTRTTFGQTVPSLQP